MTATPYRVISLGLLSLLPAWLGGDLVTWKLGVLALALALHGFFWPPQFNFSKPLKWALLAVLLWPLIGLFPRLVSASWHQELMAVGVDAGWFWSPQPWILLNTWFVILIVGYWILCLFGTELDSHETHVLLRVFGLAVCLLALTAVLLTLRNHMLPWWEPLYGTGPFPNRNQSGNLFGLSGLMVLALAAHESRNNRSYYVFWCLAAGLLFATTIVNGSRSGVLLFLAGVLLWSGWQTLQTRKKRRAAVVFSAALLFLSVFLFWGGQALDRIHATITSGGGGSGVLSGRWDIWKDSMHLVASAPVQGVGVGNFSELFALYRGSLMGENRVIHPESDYLWWLSETGMVGVALGGGLVVLLLKPFLKSRKNSGRRLRTAAFLASVLFLGHSLIDVSGHRLGTLIPALLWVRISWPVCRTSHRLMEPVMSTRMIPPLVMAGIGFWFIVPFFTSLPLPSTSYVAKVKQDWTEHFSKDPARALTEVKRAVTYAPLDWKLRYCLGVGLLLQEKAPDPAWRQFSIARKLEPMLSELPYQEGQLWLSEGTTDENVGRAWFVWREALKRRKLDKSGLLKDMLIKARPVPELEETLLFLAARIPELRQHVLGRLTAEEFHRERDNYLRELKPGMPQDRQIMREVFRQWGIREGTEPVADYVEKHQMWFRVGWPYLVQARVAGEKYREAYQLMKDSFPVPPQPHITESLETRNEHLRRIRQGVGDLVSVYSFLKYDQDKLSFEQGKALITDLFRTDTVPAYIRYLLAEYYAENMDWRNAVGQMEGYGRSLEK